MLPRTYTDQVCQIARGLELVGERWTLLILRDAFFGVRRFDDFQARLELSRNVLTQRLSALVDEGLLRREPYQQRPLRHEYLLTEKALELWPVLIALGQWGARHASPDGAAREFLHASCATPLHAAVRCPECDVDVAPSEAISRPGPGYRANPRVPDELRQPLEQPRSVLASLR